MSIDVMDDVSLDHLAVNGVYQNYPLDLIIFTIVTTMHFEGIILRLCKHSVST